MPADFDDILLIVVVFAAVYLATIWLSLVLWAYRDMRQRSRDPVALALVVFLVLLLNAPGIIVYILLRPRETLTEVYERSLEEEALLQEIEERTVCPNCSQRVQSNWQACPHCHARLKKLCVSCDYILDLQWNICPRCTTLQVKTTSDGSIATDSRHVSPAEPPPIETKWIAS